ncbi:MAG: LysR substrate-binding domain-containing protein [Geminicoccaceae bacterium]
MQQIDLPTNLLRTLITIVDLGGYTRAAEALGRTQPAVSLQMQRLEQLLGTKLIDPAGRDMRLTETGETLVRYARQMLQLNDEVVATFIEPQATGVLRIGLPTDYAVAFLQQALAGFTCDHPDVTLEIHCDLSQRLMTLLQQDTLDVVVGLSTSERSPYLVKSWDDVPVWAAAKSYVIDRKAPLTLVAHPEGCEYRSRMLSALADDKRAWRMALTNPDISGLQQAVAAGLGVTALTAKTLTPEMRVLDRKDGLPPLDNIHIGLFYKHAQLTSAGLLLVNLLIERLDQAAKARSGQ